MPPKAATKLISCLSCWKTDWKKNIRKADGSCRFNAVFPQKKYMAPVLDKKKERKGIIKFLRICRCNRQKKESNEFFPVAALTTDGFPTAIKDSRLASEASSIRHPVQLKSAVHGIRLQIDTRICRMNVAWQP